MRPATTLRPRSGSAPNPLATETDSRTGTPPGDGPGAGDPSDHDLIRRAQEGEEAAFALLVERHEERALRVARNLVANQEDARDLAQEAFIRVFRSLDRFDFRHEFTTWLYRIVTNLAIDSLRKRRPQVSTSPTEDEGGEWDLPDEDHPPFEGLEREETVSQVRACIDRLAPHFRTVMVLRELEGLACNEIAGIVGATHVTVRWRLHRGRKLFQEEWERMRRPDPLSGSGSRQHPHIPPVDPGEVFPRPEER